MPRTRRSAAEARAAILDAAAKRLREGGPEAVRLQDVARDLGISHPAILHHFGSRESLMKDLAAHVIEGIETELLQGIALAANEESVQDVLMRVFESLGDAGHARLLAWRALAVRTADEADAADGARAKTLLGSLADLVHARRSAAAAERGIAPPSREDSEFTVRLGAAALLGEGVAGAEFDRSLSAAGDTAERRRRFFAWFARLLVSHDGFPERKP
ncbi:MAG TPA: TetR family transcriptional regulator [Myxococcota bacterium]|nr:TetR family transcriptional regulator [Myxococcota bacterium]